MRSLDILTKVKEIQEERGREYEKQEGERSFTQTAIAFNAITGKDITPAEVSLLLQILKDVRIWNNGALHIDSIIDCVSYASLKGELLFEQYKQKAGEEPKLEVESIPSLLSSLLDTYPGKSLLFKVNTKSSVEVQNACFSLGIYKSQSYTSNIDKAVKLDGVILLAAQKTIFFLVEEEASKYTGSHYIHIDLTGKEYE